MRKLKLVRNVMVVCGLCFSDMYASSGGALLNEGEIIINYGIEGLQKDWSPETMASFQNSAKQCRKKLQESPLFERDEQLILMEGELASFEGIVQDLDEFATTLDDNKKEYLKSIAYHSGSRVRSLILSRLDQIEKNQSENKKQSEEGKDKKDIKNVPSTISIKSKAGSEIVKGKSSKKK